MARQIVVLSFVLLFVSGCAQIADRYTPSATNVMALKSSDKSYSVGRFTVSKSVPTDEIACLSLTIKPPENKTFSEFIRESLITDLIIAGVYSENSPNELTANLENVELDTSALYKTSDWHIELTLSLQNKSRKVATKYSFRSINIHKTACEVSAERFPDAVREVVFKIATSPLLTDSQ